MTTLACRACGAPLRHTFVDLGMAPLSNAYVAPDEDTAAEPFYPLHARVCDQCFLVQIPAVAAPDTIFGSDYAYFSSYSDTWLRHAQAYVEMMIARFGYGPPSQVVEIASNDGYLLQYFAAAGVPVLGVEPSASVARVAMEKKIPTVVKFFGVQTAAELVEQGHAADLVIGNNVLAHVPDINDFVGGIARLLKPGGTATLEFPHLLRLVAGNQFDTIYHEHFSYLSLYAVEQVFRRHGLAIFDVDELPTHGGSLRIYACHAADEAGRRTPRPAALREREASAGINRLAYYAAFSEAVKETKRKLLEFLIAARRAGHAVAAYGAAAKGNTLLNYCGIRTDFVDFVVDRNPQKQGRLLPGTHIPIFGPDKVRAARPRYLLILPWNIKDEVMDQMRDIRAWGGEFVVPIPAVRVLP